MSFQQEDRPATRPSAMPPAGEPDETGLSPQKLEMNTDKPTVKADIEERQAVEVRPMRYVLGLGLGVAILAMLVVWLLIRF